MTLEHAGPSMFLGSGILTVAQAGSPDGWTGAVLQGGALLLLAGVLWVLFKEVAPRLMDEQKELQAQRHREHIDFINSLSAMREAHLTEMGRCRESHEQVIKSIAERVKCEYNNHKPKP